MNVPLLDLKPQYAALRDEIDEAIARVCESQYFILGPTVEAFEKNIADYCGTEHAIGVTSGTDALLIALMALDVGPGDGVITTPYTFFATVGSICRLGATPIFVDIDPVTYNTSPAACKALLEAVPSRFSDLNIKAMIPVHLYGQCADMDALLAIAAEHKLAVIEDACQAIGAEYPGVNGTARAGAMGDMGCFSFFPSKNLGGFGDGGMVTTQDEALAERMRMLRNHGAQPKYYHRLIGGNFRLDAIQAAVLDVKLRHLDDWHKARRENAARYDAAFADSAVTPPHARYRDSDAEHFHIYNQYIVRVADRDAQREKLQAAGIGCEVYYPVPLHLQDCFASLGHQAGDFPESEKAANETLALPIYPELTEDMQAHVAETLMN